MINLLTYHQGLFGGIMSKTQSIWSKADKFLTLTRKIFLNSATILVLILITFSMIIAIGTIFSSEEKVILKTKFYGLSQ